MQTRSCLVQQNLFNLLDRIQPKPPAAAEEYGQSWAIYALSLPFFLRLSFFRAGCLFSPALTPFLAFIKQLARQS